MEVGGLRPPTSCSLFHKQHLAISRQRPQILRHEGFERIARLAERVHRRNDLVAEPFGVLERVAIAFVLEQRLELFDA